MEGLMQANPLHILFFYVQMYLKLSIYEIADID